MTEVTYSALIMRADQVDLNGDLFSVEALKAAAELANKRGLYLHLNDRWSGGGVDDILGTADLEADDEGLHATGKLMDVKAAESLREIAENGLKVELYAVPYGICRKVTENDDGTRTIEDVSVLGVSLTQHPVDKHLTPVQFTVGGKVSNEGNP